MKNYLIAALLLFLPFNDLAACENAITFTDSSAREVCLKISPARVVSLVPSITEILFQLGVDNRLVGITLHDSSHLKATSKTIVGGFLHPNLNRVAALKPDVIFYADIQKGVVEKFAEHTTLINLSSISVEDSFKQISLLGKIFAKNDEAQNIIREQQRLLTLIKKKTNLIPQEEKLRTVRIMGRDKMIVPGDDSFQNDYIRRAGGIAPKFGQNGNIIEPTLKAWQQFNPQVIYGCGANRSDLTILTKPGWSEVDAVKHNRILFFPCALTCRASTHTGYFVAWLAARLYENSFSDPDQLVLPAEVVQRKKIDLGFGYILSTEKLYSDILDFRNKSLLISFKTPMAILSTLEGWRQNIKRVGNHYFPPPSWGLGHNEGLDGLQKRTYAALNLDKEDSAMLFTGADMDNLAIATARYKEMKVTALVTAGVKGNAIRMSKETGLYYELEKVTSDKEQEKPGTINTILLTNTRLSKRAMTRALISAVEGKTAALQDLDIRSSGAPLHYQATGTGTDNIIVIQGDGPPVDATGGHTKMGELIAKAVYDGVSEAIAKQNGIAGKRSIFARLSDRKISISQLKNPDSKDKLLRERIEQLLLEPVYSNFITAAMAINDAHEQGLINGLDAFDSWCQSIAEQIAGKEVTIRETQNPKHPLVLRKAFGALVSGLQQR